MYVALDPPPPTPPHTHFLSLGGRAVHAFQKETIVQTGQWFQLPTPSNLPSPDTSLLVLKHDGPHPDYGSRNFPPGETFWWAWSRPRHDFFLSPFSTLLSTVG
jgi:hypothetical protein